MSGFRPEEREQGHGPEWPLGAAAIAMLALILYSGGQLVGLW